MKIGKISYVNKKGQVVIPSKYRKELGITEETPLHIVRNEAGLLVYPITDLPTPGKSINNEAYEKILDASQGAWADDDWPEREKKQREVELKAARRRKQKW